MSRKVSKRKKKSPIKKTGFTAADIMYASRTDPLDPKVQQEYFTRIRKALDNLITCDSPAPGSWDLINDICNFTETLVIDGHCTDDDGIAKKANAALFSCGKTFLQTGVMKVTDEDVFALRSMIEDFEAIVPVLSHRDLLQIFRNTSYRLEQEKKLAKRMRKRQGTESGAAMAA